MKRLTWQEMKTKFPNEWVAFIDYQEVDGFPSEGIPVTHHPDRKLFHEAVEKLLPQYGNMALRYTGQRVKNSEIPLLWQILDLTETAA